MKKPTKTAEVKSQSDTKLDAKTQTDNFSKAMKAFNTGDFRKAKPIFEQAAQGPSISVTETALRFIRMCDLRLAQEKVVLETADDHYNYAIGLMNDRRPSEARKYLDQALSLSTAPHIFYAHALAAGLSSDFETALSSLRKAMELDPGTRNHARHDPDFQPLLQNPSIREALTSVDRQEPA